MGLNIVTDDMVYHKVMHWVSKSDVEVSGLGKVIVDGDTIRVVDAMLFPQTGTGASTEIEPEAICRAMYELRDTPGELKWWWHSHVKMEVFWSGTDIETIEELSSQGWFAATVFNQHEQTRSAYAQAAPVKVMVDELDLTVTRDIDDALVASWDAEYASNVKVPVSSAVQKEFWEPRRDDGWWLNYADELDLSEPMSWSEEAEVVQAALRRGELG